MYASGVDGPDARAELLPEAGRLDFQRDIQPPAIDTLVQPVFGHIEDEVAHRRVIGVQLGQLAIIEPAFIIRLARFIEGVEREFLDGEPLAVRRLRRRSPSGD